jgi:hypothetical protein
MTAPYFLPVKPAQNALAISLWQMSRARNQTALIVMAKIAQFGVSLVLSNQSHMVVPNFKARVSQPA